MQTSLQRQAMLRGMEPLVEENEELKQSLQELGSDLEEISSSRDEEKARANCLAEEKEGNAPYLGLISGVLLIVFLSDFGESY